MHKEFPRHLSYNCFVERQTKIGLHLLLFLQTCALGKCTSISIIDSTPLVSCHIKRTSSHRTIRGGVGGYQGKKHDERVLRIQAPYRNQQPRRDYKWTHTPENIDNRKPLKKQGLHPKSVRKAIHRQARHKPIPFRNPFCWQHTPYHENKEKHKKTRFWTYTLRWDWPYRSPWLWSGNWQKAAELIGYESALGNGTGSYAGTTPGYVSAINTALFELNESTESRIGQNIAVVTIKRKLSSAGQHKK